MKPPKHQRRVHVCTEREWKEIRDRMRSTLTPPEGYSWRVQRCDMEDDGDIRLVEKSATFMIRICKWQTATEMEDALFHEVGHCWVWPVGGGAHHEDHGELWGLAKWKAERLYRGWK